MTMGTDGVPEGMMVSGVFMESATVIHQKRKKQGFVPVS
jgi:hypothetical protein